MRQNVAAAACSKNIVSQRRRAMRTAISIIVLLGCIACTPEYTPLSYITADIDPVVHCAKYVLPDDVELLRKAGGWQIGQ